MENTTALQRAAHWLSQSGLQNQSRNSHLRGGVAAWYEIQERQYPFLYSEITGYAISTFVFLSRVTGKKKWLKNAALAARWLIDHATGADGGVKTRFYLIKHYVSPNYCFHQGRVYAFDTAMAGYGLLQLYREVKKEEYLKAAGHSLGFLIDQMRKKDGSFFPYFDSKTKKPGEDLEKWSDQAGTFHAKLALFLIDYYRLTQDRYYKRCAESLLDAVLQKQEKDGRFVTGRSDLSTHLHPHSYTLEGLSYGGQHLKRKDYWVACHKGFLWMLKGVSGDGSVSSIYTDGSFSHHERSDIVAQVLRIGAILYTQNPKAMRPHLEV